MRSAFNGRTGSAAIFAGCRGTFQEAAFEITTKLAADIFDPTINVKPMTGLRSVYRAVVVREYRLVFSFDNDNIYLLRISHRRKIYRNLEI